ncbi:hypothetical protein GE21DRAFT_1206704 [Neurospora crassa]|nr:hypothetical protein B7J19.140 [imported] - Neurospora crassa [Neurospora crassa]KHE85229.1 hypothetical protein GE21DRAFT_1206704 [Neurospora crassa]
MDLKVTGVSYMDGQTVVFSPLLHSTTHLHTTHGRFHGRGHRLDSNGLFVFSLHGVGRKRISRRKGFVAGSGLMVLRSQYCRTHGWDSFDSTSTGEPCCTCLVRDRIGEVFGHSLGG